MAGATIATTTRLYFAYGSNMSTARLRARLPAAQPVGSARIEGFRLVCNKRGKDGSGKANLVRAEQSEAWGVLFTLDAGGSGDDWEVLDRFEWGYARHVHRVVDPRGVRREVQLYLALRPEPRDIPPFDWYRAHCLEGAREHRLPRSVVEEIASWTVEVAPAQARTPMR